MDIMRIPLTIIFKEQNPYRILANYFNYNSCKEDNYRKINKKKFLYLYQNIDIRKSREEIENIFDIINQKMKKEEYVKEESVFNLLINYTEDVLEDLGDDVQCKYKNLLKWRMTSHKLDQDVLISSFISYKDILLNRKRHCFDWNLNIKSNNNRLHNILSHGISENHFHLKGSAPTYYLSWISLMNKLSNRNLPDKEIDDNRLEIDVEGDFRIKEGIVVAALLRVILFYAIESSEKYNKEIEKLSECLKEIIDTKESRIRREQLLMNVSKIQSEINVLKMRYFDKCKEVKIDYALCDSMDISDKSTYLFQGERRLMYECFKKIYSNVKEFDEFKDLFYAYLIIKSKLRAELIQINDKVGFSNFSDYQNRKTEFIDATGEISKNIAPTAILSSIKNQNIVSLEARVTPGKTTRINIKGIKNSDHQICNKIIEDSYNNWKKDGEYLYILDKINISDEEKNDIIRSIQYEKIKSKFFYVFHFIKKTDKNINKYKNNSIYVHECRHKAYRKELKKWAIAIAKLREGNPNISERLKGIDAASNELVIRPEVYGQAYRFLKKHLPSNPNSAIIYENFNVKRLRATYHVGEDFLDLLDGLRAIDETVTFLEFCHGDRLGHAIALGINVYDWYLSKGNKVYLSKQDILDNIAWLIIKIKEFNIYDGSMIIHKLTQIYNKYFLEIYTDNFVEYYKKDENTNLAYKDDSINLVSVDTYMKAWELRGDNPEYYNSEYEKLETLNFWHRCAKRHGIENLRSSNLIINLFLNYQYNPKVKKIGYQKDILKIEPYMIEIIEKIQKGMQSFIRERGIGVETNPTSNYLISNFKRYDKHPILNLYNLGLTIDEDEADNYSQLFVSINTDDQGVFGTLLENEYALMAIALEKAKDKNGNKKYSQAMIYDWIDRVRKMGIEQSFNELDNISN